MSTPINIKPYFELINLNPITYSFKNIAYNPYILYKISDSIKENRSDETNEKCNSNLPSPSSKFAFDSNTLEFFAPNCKCQVSDDMVLFESDSLVFGNCNECIKSKKDFGNLYKMINENFPSKMAYQYKSELIFISSTNYLNALIETNDKENIKY